jgi:hypothetical protein
MKQPIFGEALTYLSVMQVRILKLDGKIGVDIRVVDQVLASLVYLRKEGKFFEKHNRPLMIYLVPNSYVGCLTLMSLVRWMLQPLLCLICESLKTVAWLLSVVEDPCKCNIELSNGILPKLILILTKF